MADGATAALATADAWNAALAGELLDGRFEGRPLYLYLEPDRLDQLAREVGEPLSSAVSRSLRWRDRAALFDRHQRACRMWEAGGKAGPPPFLALLTALSTAAAAMVADHRFAATNYYSRLIDLFGVSGADADKLRRDFATTIPLWRAFNDWLDDWEGALGVPTARVQGRLVYVGYPISQALVRERDRQALPDVFNRYGLPPGRRIGMAQMQTYLGDWVGRGQAPAALARLWNTDDAVRERIAQIACDELEHWGGKRFAVVSPRDEVRAPSRLEWLAELSLEPTPEIGLYLTSDGDPETWAGKWGLGARTDDPGRAAVEACLDDLRLLTLPGLDALSLEPWDRIGVASLLAGVLELVRKDQPGLHLLRSPAPVLALAFDERDARYRETSKAQLLERCLVLAHDGVANAVDRHLQVHARPGYRRWNAGTVRNLPAGWTLFADVVLVKAADETRHSQCAALCAAPATAIELSGGLKLGQNTWHVARPPEVLATVDPETAPFGLTLFDRRAETSSSLGRFVGRAATALNTSDAGDYDVQIVRRRTDGESVVVRHAGVRLRSADHPRPAGVRRDPGLAYRLDRAFSLFSAEPTEGGIVPGLRGVLVVHDVAEEARASSLALPLPARRPALTETIGARSGRADSREFNQSCAVRGHHHWDCEPAGPDDDYKTLKWQECRLCHQFEWTRNRGVGPSRPPSRNRRAPVRAPSVLPRYARPSISQTEAYDLLLDALSYGSAGRAEQLRALGGELDSDPLFAWRAARDLAALGHIDLAYDCKTARLSSWQASPPALAETADGSWVLTGARSATVVQALGRLLEAAGAPLESETPDRGPTVWRSRATADLLRALPLSDLRTPIGEGITLVPAISRRLAAAVPRLRSILATLPAFQIGARSLERFDPISAQWTAAEPDRPGAYRLDDWGRTYGFASEADLRDGIMRLADAPIVKHLAAQVEGVSLLGYDPERRALTTPLGADLPTVLERAAVACRGVLPRLRTDLGLLEYAGVDTELAERLQAVLHSPSTEEAA